jgi:hypothetical protein
MKVKKKRGRRRLARGKRETRIPYGDIIVITANMDDEESVLAGVEYLGEHAHKPTFMAATHVMNDDGEMEKRIYAEQWFTDFVEDKGPLWSVFTEALSGDGDTWQTFSMLEVDLQRIGRLNPPRIAVEYPLDSSSPRFVRASWKVEDLTSELRRWLASHCLHRRAYYGGLPPKREPDLGWAEDDRKWFEERPDQDFRLRDPWGGELEEADLIGLATFLDEQIPVNHIEGKLDHKVLIVRIEEGVRARVPVIEVDGGRLWFSISGPAGEAIEYFKLGDLVEVVHQVGEDAVPEAEGDLGHCFSCGHRWQHGDLTFNLSHYTSVPDTYVCQPCLFRSGYPPMGFTIFESPGELSDEDHERYETNAQVLQELIEEVEGGS